VIITVGPDSDAACVRQELVHRGLWVRRFDGADVVRFVVEPHSARVGREELLRIPGVADVSVPKSTTPLLDGHPPVVRVRGLDIGVGAAPILMAGPCSVESEERILALAGQAAAAGASFLRGGAFKPRTSCYDFQGLGEQALGWMRRAADAHGLRVITEALEPGEVPVVAAHTDVLQIGARNMHSARLLRAAGATGLVVMLKRGMAATIEEWTAAAETLLVHGARGVIFCERGVRSFDPATRFTVDLGAVALIAHVLQLPVIVDPSHGAGRRDLVPALCRAGIAAGASGVMVEVHDAPGEALSDGPQAITPAVLASLGNELFSVRQPTTRDCRPSLTIGSRVS
jgi:3-deoxy-7-phosphoheptulonate synthase